jgi:hypothetical protein
LLYADESSLSHVPGKIGKADRALGAECAKAGPSPVGPAIPPSDLYPYSYPVAAQIGWETTGLHRNIRAQSEPAGRSRRFRYAVPHNILRCTRRGIPHIVVFPDSPLHTGGVWLTFPVPLCVPFHGRVRGENADRDRDPAAGLRMRAYPRKHSASARSPCLFGASFLPAQSRAGL